MNPKAAGADWAPARTDGPLYQAYAIAATRALWTRAGQISQELGISGRLSERLRESCPKGMWLSPEAAWLLGPGLDEPTEDRIGRAVARVDDAHGPAPPPCALRYPTLWSTYALAVISRDLRTAGYYENLVGLDGSWGDRLARALALVERVWPEAMEEVARLVREVAFIRGHGLRSATLAPVFGLVLVGTSAAYSDIRLGEFLVHETAHLALTVRQAFGPFLTNPDFMATSPLRPDPRPLDAVLHAAFVLRRVCEFLQRIRAVKPSDDEVSGLLATYETQLAMAVTTLKSVARWTERGERLYASMNVV